MLVSTERPYSTAAMLQPLPRCLDEFFDEGGRQRLWWGRRDAGLGYRKLGGRIIARAGRKALRAESSTGSSPVHAAAFLREGELVSSLQVFCGVHPGVLAA